jgi:DNA helicase-2/ATP-dependent DNA helicase PcrA
MDFVLGNHPAPDSVPLIDFRAQLNDEQYGAVTAEPGPLLVLAGAGSGKTRTLTYRVAWLLSKGVRAGEILLLTFTNKAAKQMLHRVEELTGIEPKRFWGGPSTRSATGPSGCSASRSGSQRPSRSWTPRRRSAS